MRQLNPSLLPFRTPAVGLPVLLLLTMGILLFQPPGDLAKARPLTDAVAEKTFEEKNRARWVEGVDSSDFEGTWTVEKDRSSAIDPWKNLTLQIEASESELVLKRIWKGHYGYSAVDSIRIPLDGEPHSAPLHTWPDNRHIGVFVGDEGERSVSASWIDEGRTLRVTTRFPAEVSQGQAELRIRSEYRLSPSGSRLTLLELRSTRPKPIRYTFERAPAAGD